MTMQGESLHRVATAKRGWGVHVVWLGAAILLDLAGAVALTKYASAPADDTNAALLAAGILAFPISTVLLVMWLQEGGVLGFLYARTVDGDLRIGRLIPLATLGRGVSMSGGSLAIGVEGDPLEPLEATFSPGRIGGWHRWSVRSPVGRVAFHSTHTVTPELRNQIQEWCRARGVAVTVANFAY